MVKELQCFRRISYDPPKELQEREASVCSLEIAVGVAVYKASVQESQYSIREMLNNIIVLRI